LQFRSFSFPFISFPFLFFSAGLGLRPTPSMEEVQNSYYQVQEYLSKAKEMATAASKGNNILEACSKGMKYIEQAEKETTAMSSKSKMLSGDEAKTAQGQVVECRNEI